MSKAHLQWIVCAAGLVAVACNLTDPVGGDAGEGMDGDVRDDAADGMDALLDDADDATSDEPLPMGGGSLVQVVTALEFHSDRLCDLDGDGLGDNAFADLGAPAQDLFATAVSTTVAGSIADDSRVLLHLPWVDELSTPHAEGAAQLLIYGGADTDFPRDTSDDFSGDEPFFVEHQYLDGCGEPRYFTSEASLDDGHLTLRSGVVPLKIEDHPMVLRGCQVDVHVEPAGRGSAGTLCGYATFSDLGDHPGLLAPESSFLEELTVGGVLFGISALPGLSFDVDVDGDGLERLVIDDDNRIASCIDGDGTVIVGSDCWQDPRMADGISFTMHLEAIRARFAGREPAWEHRVEGDCADGPPATSLFDGGDLFHEGPCALLDEICDPLSLSPCCNAEARCSGANLVEYRCLGPCVPRGCDFDGGYGICTDAGGCAPPIRGRGSTSECSPDGGTCQTVYGVESNTRCFVEPPLSFCFEICDPGTEDTGCLYGNDHCVPLPDDHESGVCSVPADAAE